MARPKREWEEGMNSDAGEYPHRKRPRRDSLEGAEDDFARAQASLDRKRRQRQQPTQQQTSTMSEAHEFANVSADRLYRLQTYNERRHDVVGHDRLSSRPSSGPHRPSNQHQATSDRRHMIQHHNDHRHDAATHDRLSSRPSSGPHRSSNQPRPSHQVHRESYDSYVPQQTLARDQTRRPENHDREIKPRPGSRPQNPSRGVYHDFAREGRGRPAPSRFDPPAQPRGSDRDQRPSYRSLSRGDNHGWGQSIQREPDITSDRGRFHRPPRFTERRFQPPQEIRDKPPFCEKVKLNKEDAEKLVTHGRQSIDRHVELRCGNCGHRGHRLIDCIWPDLSGQISGCPLCNTKLHHLDECARVSRLSKAQLYHLLVHRRGNRPAIASRTPWVDLVMGAATSSIEIKDPRGGPFPWTKDFAKSQGHVWCKYANRSGPLWEFYDYRAGKEERMPLPIDPKTKNLEKVLSSVEELRRTEVHLGLGQNALTL
ncbi:hypothetical protein GCG54_00002612 [Colletotrichum gloeosporioides]|uniref:Uncharacterized protein n=1 Tax=Colletotrichum gloeosporioides TaxID=474922 RepID=A0A8H4CU51_COLGL|nr:uncharacterized protein GCG54_00002612 [Colletotrichum gloeosporioides]KAF3810160.1 hypothetical protein GCG54_00002612 [Colletotrichum gloeosporioides]